MILPILFLAQAFAAPQIYYYSDLSATENTANSSGYIQIIPQEPVQYPVQPITPPVIPDIQIQAEDDNDPDIVEEP
jgi:hypothetical protein